MPEYFRLPKLQTRFIVHLQHGFSMKDEGDRRWWVPFAVFVAWQFDLGKSNGQGGDERLKPGDFGFIFRFG